MVHKTIKIKALQLFIFSLFALLISQSCGSPSRPGQQAGITADDFNGVQQVVKEGKSWKVSWGLLNAEGVQYTVSQMIKKSDGSKFEWETAGTVGTGSFVFTPPDFYHEGERCFKVRVTSGLSGDDNEKEICKAPPKVQFNGLERGLESAGDGNFQIEWSTVEVPGVMYYIYSGSRGFETNIVMQKTDEADATEPEGIVSDNFFLIKTKELDINRDEEKCFVVRYSHPDLDPDTNTNVQCTPTADPIVFDGIFRVDSLASDKELTVYWLPSETEDLAEADSPVTRYRIIADDDVELEDINLNAAPAGLSTTNIGGDDYYTLTTSYPAGSEDKGIRIKVIAYDEYGRKDSNSCDVIIQLSTVNTSVVDPSKVGNCEAN
jgi:hypothetical protein